LNSHKHPINHKFSIAIFGTVLLLVMLNIFTPLRLNTDGIRYLNILEYLKGNLGNNSTAAHDYLPHGYPWLLYLLQHFNLLSSLSITLINIGAVLIAAYFLADMLAIKNRFFYFSLILASFINIKHFELPVSDQFFTLVFIGSIYLWSHVFKGKTYFIIPALLLTLLSIYIRTAGAAIIIGVLFYLCFLKKDVLFKKKVYLVTAGLLIAGFFTVFFIYLPLFEKKIDYIKQLDLASIAKNPVAIIERFSIHIKEIGEIVINSPYSKLSTLINIHGFDIAAFVLIIAGLLALYMFYRAVKQLKLYNLFVFWVYAGYLLIIIFWPFYDARFLIPIVPVFIYLFFYYLSSLSKSIIKLVPVVIYVVFGVVSLLYSDALSLSKPFFLKHYGFDQELTKKYEIHFKNEQLDKISRPVYNINDDDILYLLEKYDRSPSKNN